MRTHPARSSPLAAVAAALAFALVAGWSPGARAAFIAYGYAQQSISNVSVTPASGTLTPTTGVSTGTSTGATLNGSGTSANDNVDAAQSYLGTPPPPPQNYFQKFAAFPVASPLPSGTLPNGVTSGAGPLATFSRGDSQIAGLGTTNTVGSVVAESYLNSGPGRSATGAGALSANFSFTPSAASALTIAYSYSNDAYVAIDTNASAQSSFKFDVTIKDAAGNIIFTNAADTQTSISLGSPPNGVEILRSGTITLTTPTLLAGANYTLIFSSTANTFLSTVPEPSSWALATVGGGLLFGFTARRRLARREDAA